MSRNLIDELEKTLVLVSRGASEVLRPEPGCPLKGIIAMNRGQAVYRTQTIEISLEDTVARCYLP